MTMLRLKRIFKNYEETGSLNERVNLYGFVGPEVFLTKTCEIGLILEVRGVDCECLDAETGTNRRACFAIPKVQVFVQIRF